MTRGYYFDDLLEARPHGREVPRLEADLHRRGARPQPEITMFRVHKERIGNDAVNVLASRLPLGETPTLECDRFSRGIPVKIAIEYYVHGVPFPAHGCPLRIVDDIVPHSERKPIHYVTLHLSPFAEGKDVVL